MAGRRYDGPDVVAKKLSRTEKVGYGIAGYGAAGYAHDLAVHRISRHRGAAPFVVVGAGTAAIGAHRRRRVGKRLVDEETHTSIPRLIGMGAGMGAIAWGGSRSGALRGALRHGASNDKLDPRVRRALNLAEHTRQSLETSTAPLGRVTGRGIGRMPGPLRAALNEVPRPLRPATATLAGAILVQHARPVRQSTYSPVVEMGGY